MCRLKSWPRWMAASHPARSAPASAGRKLLRGAAAQMGLTARAYHRVLMLARTIADLAEAECIGVPHLVEALQYRPREFV